MSEFKIAFFLLKWGAFVFFFYLKFKKKGEEEEVYIYKETRASYPTFELFLVLLALLAYLFIRNDRLK